MVNTRKKSPSAADHGMFYFRFERRSNWSGSSVRVKDGLVFWPRDTVLPENPSKCGRFSGLVALFVFFPFGVTDCAWGILWHLYDR